MAETQEETFALISGVIRGKGASAGLLPVLFHGDPQTPVPAQGKKSAVQLMTVQGATQAQFTGSFVI